MRKILLPIAVLCLLLRAFPAFASGFLYLIRYEKNDVVVLDADTFKEVKKINVGIHPCETVLHKGVVYILNRGTQEREHRSVSVICAATHEKLVDNIVVPKGCFKLKTIGNNLYVYGGDGVVIIDTRTQKKIGQLECNYASSLEAHNGALCVVHGFMKQQVSFFDMKTWEECRKTEEVGECASRLIRCKGNLYVSCATPRGDSVCDKNYYLMKISFNEEEVDKVLLPERPQDFFAHKNKLYFYVKAEGALYQFDGAVLKVVAKLACYKEDVLEQEELSTPDSVLVVDDSFNVLNKTVLTKDRPGGVNLYLSVIKEKDLHSQEEPFYGAWRLRCCPEPSALINHKLYVANKSANRMSYVDLSDPYTSVEFIERDLSVSNTIAAGHIIYGTTYSGHFFALNTMTNDTIIHTKEISVDRMTGVLYVPGTLKSMCIQVIKDQLQKDNKLFSDDNLKKLPEDLHSVLNASNLKH